MKILHAMNNQYNRILAFYILYILASLNLSAVSIFTGTVSNEWNHPMNWQPQLVPGINDDVIIPASYNGFLSINQANASCRSLQYHGNHLIIMIQSGWRLIIGGDLHLHGNSSIMGSGLIEFNGSNTATIYLSAQASLLVGIIEVRKQAELRLSSDLQIPNTYLSLVSGTLNTMGNNLNVFSIQMTDSNIPKSLKIQSSNILTQRMILYFNANSTMQAYQSHITVGEFIYQHGSAQFYNLLFKPHGVFTLDGMMAQSYVNILQAEGDISMVGSKQTNAKNFHIQSLHFLSSTAVCNMTESPYVAAYYINHIQFSNSCNSNYLITDYNEINAGQIQISLNSNVTLSRFSFANTRIINGSLQVLEGADLGNNLNIQFIQPTIKTLYWIGGQGNWLDPNHWSYSSGGSSAGCIPDFFTNVVFDDQSGFSPGDSVIANHHIFCKDLLFQSNSSKPIFYTSFQHAIHLRGSLDISGVNTFDQNMPVYFYGIDIHTITTHDIPFKENLIFLSNGIWNLNGNLNLAFGTKSILHYNGRIISHGFNIHAASYVSVPNKLPITARYLDIQHTSFEVGSSYLSPGIFSVQSSNYVINAVGSTIHFNHQLNQTPLFQVTGTGDLEFHHLKFNHPLIEAKIQLNEKCKFKKIQARSDVLISGLPNTFSPSATIVDSLILYGNFKATIQAGRILTIDKSIKVASGSCNDLVYLTSSQPSVSTQIRYQGNSDSAIYHLICKGINFTYHVPVTIIGGADHLQNSGVLFLNNAIGKVFYWNGEGLNSNWNNPNNWNIHTEPHAGAANDPFVLYNPNGCLPGFLDSVVFHPYSFPVVDTVNINTNAHFTGMNWLPGSGINKFFVGSSLYTLKNYGGFRLDQNLHWQFYGVINFCANTHRSIETKSVPFTSKLLFTGFGAYDLLDDIYAPNVNVEIYSGSFITNHHTIQAKNFILNLIPYEGLNFTFDAGHSQFIIHQNSLWNLIEGYHTPITQNLSIQFLSPGAVFALTGNKNAIRIKNVRYASTQGTGVLYSTYYTNPVHIDFIEFSSHGVILGNNIFDSVFFSEGKIYNLEFGAVQTITEHLYSKGSPCFRTTIQSTKHGYRAKIAHPNCQLSVDHARLRDIEAIDNGCFNLNYIVNVGSENLGNNLNWTFIPGDPINGLGPDTVIGCADLPFEITINGFGTFQSILWDNGFTGFPYLAVRTDTITAYVTYSPACVVYDTRIITLENTIQHAYTVDSVSCFGLNDASLVYHVYGGNGTYSSFWNALNNFTILNDSTLTNLASGLYQHVVFQIGFEDVCYDTLSVHVYQPDSLIIQASINNISCFGLQDGEIQLQISGGNGGYNIHWAHNASIQSAYVNHLTEGNYVASVIDSKNCEAIYQVSIHQPDAIEVEFITQPTVCGLSQGSAIFSIQGGTVPYQYFWLHNSTLHNTQAFDLPVGLNAFYYFDANHCSDTIYFTIDQINQITAVYDIQPVTCFGFQDGKLHIDATGGNGQYLYAINYQAASLSADFDSLSSGYHVVQIVDSNGCSLIDSVYINQPAPIQLQDLNIITPRCYGDANGRITVTSFGGTGIHTYYWPDQSVYGETLNSLPSGDYSLSISDEQGCTQSFIIHLSQPDSLSLQIKSIKPISCTGKNDAEVFLEAYGGTPDYTFIHNHQTRSIPHFTHISNGYHQFFVTDINGCEASLSMIIEEPPPLAIHIDTIIAGKCGVPEGIIHVSVSGGTYPYSYLWNNGSTEINNLYAENGLNSLLVTDANGCQVDLNVEMPCINKLFIPQLLTPNGDGIGDKWFIHDLFRLYPNNHVQVFNRWGNVVFSFHGYSDQFVGISNQSHALGDGLLPESTYYYVIDLGDDWGTLTGFIELDY